MVGRLSRFSYAPGLHRMCTDWGVPSAHPAPRLSDVTQRRRILVVEDDQTIALAVRDRLAAEGFQVRTAADGQAGSPSSAGPNPTW